MITRAWTEQSLRNTWNRRYHDLRISFVSPIRFLLGHSNRNPQFEIRRACSAFRCLAVSESTTRTSVESFKRSSYSSSSDVRNVLHDTYLYKYIHTLCILPCVAFCIGRWDPTLTSRSCQKRESETEIRNDFREFLSLLLFLFFHFVLFHPRGKWEILSTDKGQMDKTKNATGQTGVNFKLEEIWERRWILKLITNGHAIESNVGGKLEDARVHTFRNISWTNASFLKLRTFHERL